MTQKTVAFYRDSCIINIVGERQPNNKRDGATNMKHKIVVELNNKFNEIPEVENLSDGTISQMVDGTIKLVTKQFNKDSIIMDNFLEAIQMLEDLHRVVQSNGRVNLNPNVDIRDREKLRNEKLIRLFLDIRWKEVMEGNTLIPLTDTGHYIVGRLNEDELTETDFALRAFKMIVSDFQQ